jgi:hypothetical protein
LNVWWGRIVVGNSKKKYKKGFARKIQLNAFKLKPMTSGTLLFNEFLHNF